MECSGIMNVFKGHMGSKGENAGMPQLPVKPKGRNQCSHEKHLLLTIN